MPQYAINPNSGRRVVVGGTTYQKLIKLGFSPKLVADDIAEQPTVKTPTPVERKPAAYEPSAPRPITIIGDPNDKAPVHPMPCSPIPLVKKSIPAPDPDVSREDGLRLIRKLLSDPEFDGFEFSLDRVHEAAALLAAKK